MIEYNIKTLVESIPEDVEIIIIGNNYNAQELEVNFPYKNCKYYKINKNLYYPKAINYGVSKSQGDIITFCDPDIFVKPGWYEPLLKKMEISSIGAVSSKLINPCTGRIIDFGMYYSRFNAIHSLCGALPTHPLAQYNRKVQSACSAVMMTKHSLFNLVGGMNNYLPYSHTDMDYCLKLKQMGYDTWVIADSEVYHKGSSDKNNSKSYSFNYLNADSKGLFYADNYNRFNLDFEQWFLESWIHFKRNHPNFPTKYVMLDFTTVYNKEDYYQAIAQMGLHICDYQNIILADRDSGNIYLHQTIPFDLLDISVPLLYFVDIFTALFDNDLWFQNRDISSDLVVDRHGNIYSLLELKNGTC